ncbi:MAG: hypothetical protein ACXVCI_18555, partial [Bdellovibrionota bacterium]
KQWMFESGTLVAMVTAEVNFNQEAAMADQKDTKQNMKPQDQNRSKPGMQNRQNANRTTNQNSDNMKRDDSKK